MYNQKQHWNELHQQGSMKDYSKKQTDFAEEVLKYFPKHAKVLELGCGLGNDSFFFTSEGNNVVATDFSEVVIKQNSEHYRKQTNLIFKTVDMSQKLPFDSSQFNVVYARLSLHYFTNQITKQLFDEIHRILKHGGLLCFVCKSTN